MLVQCFFSDMTLPSLNTGKLDGVRSNGEIKETRVSVEYKGGSRIINVQISLKDNQSLTK